MPGSSKCLVKICMPTGKSVGGGPAGHAHAGDARQAAGNGVNVGQVHGQRIVDLLAQFERRERRDRRHDRIHLSKACAKSRAISVRTFCAFK